MPDYENAIEIKDLTKKYDGFTLDSISFSVPKGCVMGFIGQNGAGKTTTIRVLLNIIKDDGGSIRMLGMKYKSCFFKCFFRSCIIRKYYRFCTKLHNLRCDCIFRHQSFLLILLVQFV